MTTTLKLTYESGNGAIEVTFPNGDVTTLTKQGDAATISIHQGDDQQALIREVGFADQVCKADNSEETNDEEGE